MEFTGDQSFGSWLKQQREKQHLTQKELALRLHCATVTIRKIEAGERRPSAYLAELLADFFSLPLQTRATFLHFARTGTMSGPVPAIIDHLSLTVPFTIDATAVCLMEARSGSLLVNQNSKQRLPIASTTKIMTALVALEQGDLNQLVPIDRAVLEEAETLDGHMIGLHAGDAIRLRDLLYALMLASGDEVALLIARAVSQSQRAFVQQMNVYAQRLDLKQTHYLTPSGMAYHMVQNAEAHYSSAEDLVRLTRYALSYPLFAQIVQLQRYVIPQTAHHRSYTWETTNTLLSNYAGATGIKTGYSEKAGYCLVFSATSGTYSLIGAILRAHDPARRTQDARRLLDWGFQILQQ